jgi:tight adherence protein C
MARSARTTTGPLGEELARTLQDVQAGMSRHDALRALAARVDVPELRSFSSAVVQADQYGVPIAQVLRVQAAEMRVKRGQRAEEQAMKLPVKLLFPTVLFIFPVLFIVLLGPAAIQILDALGGA